MDQPKGRAGPRWGMIGATDRRFVSPGAPAMPSTSEPVRAPSTARRPRRDRGSGLVEYALLVVLLAVVCVAAVTLLSRSSQGRVSPVTTSTTTAP